MVSAFCFVAATGASAARSRSMSTSTVIAPGT
jgi:hypothetical protein